MIVNEYITHLILKEKEMEDGAINSQNGFSGSIGTGILTPSGLVLILIL